MGAKNKKASREKRTSRGRKSGVGKPLGLPATFWNAHRRHLEAA
jgi:hypothetical protein